MSDRRMRLRARRRIVAVLLIVRGDFFLPQTAAPRVIAGVYQDAKGPGDEARLSAETGDSAVKLQKSFLHRIFRVRGAAKNIASEVLHSRAMQRIQALVRLQVAASAGCPQRWVPSRGG